MRGDSSHTHKGTLYPTHLRQTRPYRPSRPHAARWVRWTLMAATAPVLRSCGRRKNSCTKRHPHRLPRRVPAQHRYPRRRRRARTVEATRGALTTSQRCALRGACVAAKTVVTRLRTVRRTGRASIWTTMTTTTTVRGICAWPAHLHTRGSHTMPQFFTPFAAFSSIDHTLPPLSLQTHLFPRPCLSRHSHVPFCASSVLSISVTLSHPVPFFSFFFSFFLHLLMHYIAHVHVVTHTQYSQIFRYYSWGKLCVIHIYDTTEPFFLVWSSVCASTSFCGVGPIVLS